MSTENQIKIPLSKKNRKQFEDDFELIFMKRPVHNMSDEKLVEEVQKNAEKLQKAKDALNKQKDAKGTQNPQTQEGTQDETIGQEGNQDGKGEEGQENKDLQRADLIERFKNLFGTEPDENLPNDEISATCLKQENYLSASKNYFDLFGKKPLNEMTTEQILSSIENEKARISEANATKPKKDKNELEYNPETQMIIVKGKERRVINKQTFKIIKSDGWEEEVQKPAEIQNK